MLHKDNVVLTQVYCYRCNATTAVPATTSKFEDNGTGVLGAGEERPLFFAQVTCTTISLRLTPTTQRHDGGTGPAADSEADGADNDDDEDGGVLTLNALPSTTVSTAEPPPPQVWLLGETVRKCL